MQSMSFHLVPNFLEQYKVKEPDWGWKDAAGNSIGELTFVRTYSRIKSDGSKERWWEVCERVINGMYSLLKDHCLANRLDWNGNKAQASAQEAYDRMFHFKWTPPGRGLAQMGTPLVMDHKNAASLLNCANVSTGDMERHDPGYPFAWTTEALMLGIGVGFDTLGAGKFDVHKPEPSDEVYEIPDTREGWAISVGKLVNSYLKPNKPAVHFDYSLIRPYGSPIKTFGGTASGPEPLAEGHERIRRVLDENVGKPLSVKSIVDIQNIIGTFVVAGNARRCLPGDARVNTARGSVAIGDIRVGDLIDTVKGRHRVTAVFDQGVQDLVRIAHAMGELRCTPNHRVAVYDSLGTWKFKEAQHLTPNDHLVWDYTGAVDGVNRAPEVNSPDYGRRTATGFSTPELTPEFAWMLGLLHGDGCVITDRGRPVAVSFAMSDDHSEMSNRLVNILGGFGSPSIKQGDGNWHVVKLYNARFAEWCHAHVKQANHSINVPEWIFAADSEVRWAYLAGLFDADGSCRTKPLNMATTVYQSLADDVVRLLTSLGVPASLAYQHYGNDGWKTIIKVNIRGSQAYEKASEYLTKFSSKFEPTIRRRSGGFGFLQEFAIANGQSRYGGKLNEVITVPELNRRGIDLGGAYPSRVVSVEPAGEAPTFDIEVEDIHQFTADGLVVHNSAELALGLPTDEDFVDLKNSEVFDRPWAFMSNNSISARVGMDYTPFLANTATNGEPGYIWLDTTRKYGRLIDPPDCKDTRVSGYNPCSEQPLESYEMCCLVEAHLNRAESKEDFLRTLKFAYLYGKTVTLLTTPWEKTNAVMLRNRRIGLSTTGIAGFVEENSLADYRVWADEGYRRVCDWDVTYSEWLGIRESIRKTTVKPSGSVSLLSGASPGVHWPPGGEFFIRAIRFGDHDNTWRLLEQAGYKVEDDVYSPNTKVVYFPLHSGVKRAESDVSIFEKIHLAAEAQKYWSDNGVSVTVSFNRDTEAEAVGQVLGMYEGQLKAVSFLPMGNEVYAQQPYTRTTEADYEKQSAGLQRIALSELYNSGEEAEGEVYCTTDSCSIR